MTSCTFTAYNICLKVLPISLNFRSQSVSFYLIRNCKLASFRRYFQNFVFAFFFLVSAPASLLSDSSLLSLWPAKIESSPVSDNSCLAELIYDLINWQFLCIINR